jgi:hypothetical protein
MPPTGPSMCIVRTNRLSVWRTPRQFQGNPSCQDLSLIYREFGSRASRPSKASPEVIASSIQRPELLAHLSPMASPRLVYINQLEGIECGRWQGMASTGEVVERGVQVEAVTALSQCLTSHDHTQRPGLRSAEYLAVRQVLVPDGRPTAFGRKGQGGPPCRDTKSL